MAFKAFSWTCKYCGQLTTITEPNYSDEFVKVYGDRSKFGDVGIRHILIACPNEECKELTLEIYLHSVHINNRGNYARDEPAIKAFSLMPRSRAKPQPEYIPEEIRKNYEESCLILDDSPKASAAMARRCLQGIVRDYWDIPLNKRGNLGAEINFVKDRLTEDTWGAILAVQSVGDIGAHMEKDVDFIVDIETDEADLLVQLIETLFEDWYVERQKRQTRNNKLIDLAGRKRDQRRAAKKAAKANEMEAKEEAKVEEGE